MATDPSRDHNHAAVMDLPAKLTRQRTRLSTSDLALLKLKRSKLQAADSQVRQFIEGLGERVKNRSALVEAVQSAFVFAQEEAGTAVCIASTGLLLTCSHCLGNSRREAYSKNTWLISAIGVVVEARCTAWDGMRDLALLQIIAAEPAEQSTAPRVWPYAKVGTSMPKMNAHLLCVGHPGSEDLEHKDAGVATGYDVIHVSTGRYRGCAAAQDIQDNSEIGALMHDCWTYWGHSGAPLIDRLTGTLVGLHSSWDDETGMRRGVVLQCIDTFLSDRIEQVGTNNAGASVANAIVLE